MKKLVTLSIIASLSCNALADSAMGKSADLQEFYRAYDVNAIPMEKMQSWPYYNHVSMNMEQYLAHVLQRWLRQHLPS